MSWLYKAAFGSAEPSFEPQTVTFGRKSIQTTALLAEGGSPASREQPLVLVVGPEGGLTEEERGALLEAGAGPVRLGPHVLRIETAAEAAVAIAMGLFA